MRDGCVFDSDIDIYDSTGVSVKYKDGVVMNYSINNYMPYEGQLITINGDKGRLDVEIHIRQPWKVETPNQFRLTRNFGETKTWSVSNDEGVHGGADDKLRAMIFDKSIPDPLNKMAGSRAGSCCMKAQRNSSVRPPLRVQKRTNLKRPSTELKTVGHLFSKQ